MICLAGNLGSMKGKALVFQARADLKKIASRWLEVSSFFSHASTHCLA